MKIVRYLAAFLITALLLACSIAQAASITTYNNRAAFEAALSGMKVDPLTGIQQGTFAGYTHRADFTITSGGQYGCMSVSDCGDNSARGIFYTGSGASYLWSYAGADTFTFDSAVNGFGFDFAAPSCCGGPGLASIDGLTSDGTWGFFGIISSDAKTVFMVNQTGSFMVMDNVTYGMGSASEVPEPALPALLGIALVGLAAARRMPRA